MAWPSLTISLRRTLHQLHHLTMHTVCISSNPVIVLPSRGRIRTLHSPTPSHGHVVLVECDDGHKLPRSFVAITDELAARERG